MPLSRRKFIATTSTASAGLALAPFETIELPALSFHLPPSFSLKIMATNWGFEGSADAFCAKAKGEGYDGVEIWIPGDQKGRDEIQNACAKHGLALGMLCGGWQSDVNEHLRFFEQNVKDAVAMKPIYLNCHSGRDWFSFEDNLRFLRASYQVAEGTGVPIYHETHRGRILFAAPNTRRFIEAMPNLRLTLDISHWCAVHESLLEDQAETVNMALARTEHIHARIGHQEGPQVNDPRAPEWDGAVKAHFAWWDKIVQRRAHEGKPLTILTEFGPPHYLPALPYTQQPVADQWDINVYMMKTLRERYKF